MPEISSERRWTALAPLFRRFRAWSEDGAWLAFPTGLEVGVRAAAEARETLPILANIVLPAGLIWGSRPGLETRLEMSWMTTTFTVGRVSHRGVKVVFKNLSSRRTTRTAVLLQMKLKCLPKGSGESIEGLLHRCALGHWPAGPFEVKDRIPEATNPLRISPELLLTLRGQDADMVD